MPVIETNEQSSQNQSSTTYFDLRTLLKTTAIFTTAVGGYVLARASGWFGVNLTDMSVEDLDIKALNLETQLPSDTVSLQSYAPFEVVEGLKFQKRAVGIEFTASINSTYPYPSINPIAPLFMGDFVVVWEDGSSLDGSGHGVFGQLFSANATMLGFQFQVNTATVGDQQFPVLTTLSNGNFVVTWQDDSGLDGDSAGIFAQLFAGNTTKLGLQFQVNTATVENQYSPAITTLSNGDFVVTWQDNGDLDGNGAGIFAQRFASNATKLGVQFLVNTVTLGNQQVPAITALSNGDFVVAWQDSSNLDGSAYGLFAQRFASNATKLGMQFQVNTATVGDQFNLHLITLTNGNFVAAWQDDSGLDGDGWGSFGQLFAANATKLETQFQINTVTTGKQQDPAITPLLNGGFVAAWHDDSGLDGSEWGVFAQVFAADTTKLGSQFQVNTYTYLDQKYPVLAVLESGNLVVTWSSNGQSNGTYCRAYGIVLDLANFIPSTTAQISTQQHTTNVQTTEELSFTTELSPKPLSPSDKSPSKFTLALLGILSGGALGFSVCVGLLIYYLKKKKKQVEEKQVDPEELESLLESPFYSLEAKRVERGHTVIGDKYALINKINREEAGALFEQTSIEVVFQPGERKTKFSINQGHFGHLRLARNLKNNMFVAVKKIKNSMNNPMAIASSEAEAGLQRQLRHPNIMPLLDSVKAEGSQGEPVLYQFMPLAGFGNGEKLQSSLAQLHDDKLKVQLLLSIAQQLLSGFAAMHAQRICHRDFKPSNLVLDQDGQVYIIDFGCAIQLSWSKKEVTDRQHDLGDVYYFSPERLNFLQQQSPSYSASANDMWALGLTLYELVANQPLFANIDVEEIRKKGEGAVLNYLRSQTTYQSLADHPIWPLIEGLLLPEAKRLTAQQALDLPCWKQTDNQFSHSELYRQAFAQLKTFSVSQQEGNPKIQRVLKNEEGKYAEQQKVYEMRKNRDTHLAWNKSVESRRQYQEENNTESNSHVGESVYSQSPPFVLMPALRNQTSANNKDTLKVALRTIPSMQQN